MLTRRLLLAAPLLFAAMPAEARTWSERLVAAAEAQIGRTLIYDPAYVKIAYPGGDVPAERGVCTDVVIRAYREGLRFDLQKAVHEDMAASFAVYPRLWGLTRPDRNIDHRRVPNLETYFKRRKAALAISEDITDYRPGDLVTMLLPGNLPHIGIVSAAMNGEGSRPLMIHNIGSGTEREDILFDFPVTGHYRFRPV
jgi:hypothetical protein